MKRLRDVLGLVAGLILVASSAAHSLLGWKQISAALAAAQVPADLVRGLAIGWHFGGVAMLAFGFIVLWLFNASRRGRPVSLLPALIIGVAYIAFGVGALGVQSFDPFFLIFIVPGLLLVVASVGSPRL